MATTNDLSDSSLFDQVTLDLIRKILTSTKKPSPINNSHKIMIARSDQLRAINDASDKKLLSLLMTVKSYAPVDHSILFLLKAHEKGLSADALEVLEVIISEELQVVGKDLMDILAKSEEMPMSWAVSLFGDEAELRHQAAVAQKSSIDLNRLRGFK